MVSVIVPNYNHNEFLEERLQSVRNQSYQNMEIILLDDHSTDGSDNILQEFSKDRLVKHYVRNSVNSGSPFKQWEKGVNLAKGEYVWIAESDDSCSSDFLEVLVGILNKDKEIALAYTQSFKIDKGGFRHGTWLFNTNGLDQDPFKEGFIKNGYLFIEKYLIHKNVIPNVSGVLFRKTFLDEIRPLKTNWVFQYNADWFYYIELLCKGKIAFSPEPLNFFRSHDSSVIWTAMQSENRRKVFQKELEGRNLIRNHVRRCNLPNLNNILAEWKKSRKRFFNYYFLVCLENSDWQSFFKFVTLEPFIAIKSIYQNLKRS